ncbi:polypeptide N-acetylgalactosaminyltransferase 1-like [Limulus polyphemus]|uniref:Polypeptide N-acetylgalactosaminyltransferase n=1 Tax=Limulus polyphemus TaxID=6850 RepID=A0ABM1AZU5_LIMPO|nr:polypeptide N-acetylgalactosaminyltransferase 1-like [Limulus polyphemus]
MIITRLFTNIRRRRSTLFNLIFIAFITLGVVLWYKHMYKLRSTPGSESNSKQDANAFLTKQEIPLDFITIEKNEQSQKVVRINPFQPESLQNPQSAVNINGLNMQIQEPILKEKNYNDYSANLKGVLPPPLPAELMRQSDKNGKKNDIERIDEERVSMNVKPKVKVEKVYDDGIMKVIPGLGEQGRPVFLNESEQTLADDLFRSAAFNIYLSDRISLNRSLPDARHPMCKNIQYDEDLPTASVVIIFTNEAWSPLLRTIYSVLNRSPVHLLHEIILVDDFSDQDHLKWKLDDYIKRNFPAKKIKLLRLNKRAGLIRARLAGAKIATGDVLVFLDSHCETTVMWLEPLLQRIKENRKVVLCPIIDVIDDKTLEYSSISGDYFQIGGFTWSGHFTWIEIPEWEKERKKNAVAATRSPTMAGGLFAIERDYFWEIGSYDEEMDIWGGENLEMSFRAWMCGGSLEIIPCSHVGHIFRSFHPYSFPGNKDTHGINTVRTVEVWMDKYKKYFYMYREDLKSINFGDITKRLELRDKLKCKDFGWYLKNVYPQKFIVDENVFAFGRVRNPTTNLCLDKLNRNEDKSEALGLFYCNTQIAFVMNQLFSLSANNELRDEKNCADVTSFTSQKQKVMMVKCHGRGEGQEWHHTKDGAIIHKETGKCLDVTGSKADMDVYLTECKETDMQMWQFQNYVNM